jgi:ubiquinone/menaquinone biosynthesis C-methylase UbiE
MESSFLNPTHAVRAIGLHEGMTVADFGSGSGFFTRAAAHLVGKSGHVYAIDAHREGLKRIRSLGLLEGLKNIEIVTGDIEGRQGSHLPEQSMDFIIVSNILFSAENKDAIIEEVWRTLKKSGRALVIDWKGSFGGLGPHASHVITEAKARGLFEKGGFAVIKEIPAGAYHWGFLIKKVTP